MKPKRGDPTVVPCMDEFGPLNLLSRPGKQWAPRIVKGETSPAPRRRRRRRATYTRTKGVRHLMASYDLGQDKLCGHVKTKKDRTTFLAFCRHLRSLYPPTVRTGIVLDKLQPAPLDEEGPASRRVGGRQQRRACLRAGQRQLAQPHRGSVPGAALLRPRWHRPPLTRRAELDGPSLHRLTQPPRSGRKAP